MGEDKKKKIRWLASWISILDSFTPETFEDVPPQAELAPKEKIDYKTMESFVRCIVYVSLT